MLIELQSKGQIHRLPESVLENITIGTSLAPVTQSFREAVRGVVRHNIHPGGGLFFRVFEQYNSSTLLLATMGYTAGDARSLKRLKRCVSAVGYDFKADAYPLQHPHTFHHSRGVLLTYPQHF